MIRNTPKNAEPTAKAKLPPFVRGCFALARCCWQGLSGQWDLPQHFSAFCSASSAPKHWVYRILRRTRSRSSRFPRTAFCAATTGSCPGAGSISGKSGRGGNGGHEAADRTFHPGGVDPQCGNCSAGRRHPAERSGASGAVAGRCQRGVSVHPFGAGSGNVAEQSALPCGAAGTDSRAFYGTGAHPRAGTRAVHGRVFLHGAAGLSATAALGGVVRTPLAGFRPETVRVRVWPSWTVWSPMWLK